jgi:hypothetical protein
MSEKKMTGDQLFGFEPMTPKSPDPVDPPQAPPAVPETPPAPEPTPDTPEPASPPAAPPTDPPETPVAPEPTFDFATHFGEKYKSPDEIKTVLTQYEQVVQENQTLKEAVEQVQNPFVNDTVYKLNALVKKGVDPKLAYRLANLTEETIKQKASQEVIALLEMAEIPEMVAMENDLMEEIRYRYDTNILSEDDGYTPEQVEESKRKAKRNELMMAKDAAKAREKLLEISKVDPMEVKDPVATARERQQQVEQQSRQWGEIVPKLVQDMLAEVPIFKEVYNEETKQVEYKELTKFKLSEERLKKLNEQLRQSAIANNTPLTKEGLRSLYSEGYASILAHNHAAITSAVITSVSGAATQEAEQAFYRPTDPTKPAAQRPVTGTDNLTHDERIQKQGDTLFPERSGRR